MTEKTLQGRPHFETRSNEKEKERQTPEAMTVTECRGALGQKNNHTLVGTILSPSKSRGSEWGWWYD